ncbi:MAG: threonine aldolase [Spirochaetales bacterium]|nr:threonine aldolase [Spirochaetales bacterium]
MDRIDQTTADRWFASDNNASVHPAVMDALVQANKGHAVGYGDDEYTDRVDGVFRDVFGSESTAFLVWNGTGANVMALSSLLRPWEGVICTNFGHIALDEAGAPERVAGIKVFPVQTAAGKLTPDQITEKVKELGWIHSNLPRMVSVSQPTETGLVYTPDELEKIGYVCRKNRLLLHVDGARLSNAAVYLGIGLKEAAGPADVLSFGGTKNGLMCAEALVFFHGCEPAGIGNLRKNILQLASKMRYLSVQYEVYLRDGLWQHNAAHANRLAADLARSVKESLGLDPVYPVETNAVFARLARPVIDRLIKKWFFYVFNQSEGIARWMCSWDNTESDVFRFVQDLIEATEN